MLYRNIKTGDLVNVNTPVCGEWEPVEKQAPVIAEPEEKPAKTKKAPAKKTTKKKTR